MAKRSPRAPERAARPELRLSTGTRIPLDGDLVFLIDALYRDFAVKRGFTPAYADVQKELTRVLDQLDPQATRDYFAQSLFLNYVTYENEMADRLAEKFTHKAKGAKRR